MRAVALSVVAIGGSALAYACCGVSGGSPVRFFAQRNIIVWDQTTKTEDFIRSASFRSDAKDFGFIAPTPTVPEISEVKASAFAFLASLGPKQRNRPSPAGGGFGGGGSAGEPLVVQVKEVGGYLATTLLASDAKGLAAWMKENGYITSPAIEDWTRFYIRKNWYLTAFKVINKDSDPQTGVIKLRFRTERPFNPYFVPRENLPEGKKSAGLLVYFLAAQPVAPIRQAGHTGFRQAWSKRLADEEARALLPLLKLDSLPKNASLQSFMDPDFPNVDARDDLYFAPAPQRIGFLSFVSAALTF